LSFVFAGQNQEVVTLAKSPIKLSTKGGKLVQDGMFATTSYCLRRNIPFSLRPTSLRASNQLGYKLRLGNHLQDNSRDRIQNAVPLKFRQCRRHRMAIPDYRGGGLVADAMVEQTVALQVPIAVLYARDLQEDGLCRKKKMRI
jgi:hypothetical protein